MEQQSAVEWLAEIIRFANKELYAEMFEEIKQAKEMEKEQHKETWEIAHQAGRFEGEGICEKNWQTFETHWEKTFKNK